MTLNGFLILLVYAKTRDLIERRAGSAAEVGAVLSHLERTCGEESLEQNLGD